ncbi:MAG: branched-chain amino acid ABC transporter permease [Candidatus Korarchaeota archaeon NZ13-K]|nr:MAG: branched-chain amino acid ABC transporter permease [Candidatus Korarchaeota archaeon NZ13-K]
MSLSRSFIYLCLIALLLALPIIFMVLDLGFAAAALYLCVQYSIMAMAWNFLAGYAGQVSFGHAVFFGVGAYTTMILLLFYEVTPWVGIPIGGIMAALLGLGLSFLFRLRSHWFSLATLALVTIFLLLFQEFAPGRAAGLQVPIVPPERELYYLRYAGAYYYIYLALAYLGVEVLLMNYLVRRDIGYYLQAIREDEETAMLLGINPFKYKVLAMLVSSFFMGIAGGIYTVRFRFVDPYSVFDLLLISIYPVIASLLGGMYTFWGPVVGSFIFVPIFEYIRSNVVTAFPRYFGLHFLVAGIILFLISLRVPRGVVGWLESRGYLRRPTHGR